MDLTMNHKTRTFRELLSTMFKSHPWHGVTAGADAPAFVTSYIEIAPPGEVKLELDKGTGHLHVDRPQRFSSNCPTLYGFIPQTYCGDGISKLANKHAKNKTHRGDGDPLDICVLTEKEFAHGDLLVRARVIGGLLMVDKGEADDKIIAVLDQDITYGHIRDISEVPPGVIERLQHYFLSYKRPPSEAENCNTPVVTIDEVYGRKRAYEVISQSQADYVQTYGTEESRLEELRQILSAGIQVGGSQAQNGNGSKESARVEKKSDKKGKKKTSPKAEKKSDKKTKKKTAAKVEKKSDKKTKKTNVPEADKTEKAVVD